MSIPQLNLLVLRSLDLNRTCDFYSLLGLQFLQEQHGQGPIHMASESAGLVIEIYPAQTVAQVDSTTRLGFHIGDVAAVVASVRDYGCEIPSEPRKSQWGLRAVVKDPDGRMVELVQHAGTASG